MERRYQVFVSSTFLDLREERQQVIQALLELDCLPSVMEIFPASDEETWDLIRRVIADCDYYVVIIGGRYGSVDADGLSYTEREYDYAVEAGIPVLAFLHAAPAAIPAGNSEFEPVARVRLNAFRAKVEAKMCRRYKTPEELGGLVSRSLIQCIKRSPGEGWVRGKFASSPEEINSLRSRIEELTKQLDQARTQPPPSAEGLAKEGEAFTLHYTDLDFVSTSKKVLTWDEIFACLGPIMFDEASEKELKAQLEATVAGSSGITQFFPLRLREEDFQTIKVQLMALGLITKSIRKRSLRSTGTYWTLTPYGEHRATVLKAIRSQKK